MRADERGFDVAAVPGSGPEGLVIERDVLGFTPADVVKATPLAKKVAELEGVDLKETTGTGSHGKITRDEESVDMLDLIFDNRVYDIGSIFNFGGFGQDMYQLSVTYKSDYASLWAKNESKYQTKLDKFVSDYEGI